MCGRSQAANGVGRRGFGRTGVIIVSEIRTGRGGEMLTEQQRQKFELARQMAKEEMEQLDKEINQELSKMKDRLSELQQAKKAVKQIYDGACARMGVKGSMEVKDYNLTDLFRQAV
jgi:hypothetical protein